MTAIQRYYGLRGQLCDVKLKDNYLRGGKEYDLKEISDYVISVVKEWGYNEGTIHPVFELSKRGSFTIFNLVRLYDMDDDPGTMIIIEMDIDDITNLNGASIDITRIVSKSNNESSDEYL